ncbi:MAG TPA: adenylosuccinate synthase [Euryarchaeota archaeon]|nr:adenylosuccinate synthase [Euryarchaeota archaeon]
MPATILLGTQWGDEGKGKICDILARDSDAVVRYQGGNNAGHTIVVDNEVFKLHIIPSGILREGQLAVIGDGCVVDPWELKKEIEHLTSRGIPVDRLVISDRAHMIMPYHRTIDSLQEGFRSREKKVGTTGRGIGPCYQDKAARTGLRVGDLRYPETLRDKVSQAVSAANMVISGLSPGTPGIDPEELLGELVAISKELLPYIRDVPALINDLLDREGGVLLEGAQGAFLDLDKGTYPFVTSSSCTAGYGCAGAGIGPLDIERVVGVVKAYTTRVGEGPFPTEMRNQIGEIIQKRGHEFGTTTDRPRRCGWLDLVMVRSAVNWNSITDLALTKIDVLSGIDPLMVCKEYRIPQDAAELHGTGTTLRHFPSQIELLARAEPVYIKVKGWEDMSTEDWMEIKASGEIPRRVRDYMDLIEREVLANIIMLSFGKGREQTMDLSGEGL